MMTSFRLHATRALAALAGGVLTVAGCGPAPTEDGPDTELVPSALMYGDLGCGLDWCGDNAATLGDGIVFSELDASQATENSGGVRILSARLGTAPVDIVVRRQRLHVIKGGEDIPSSKFTAKHNTPIPLTIRLRHRDGAVYELLLEEELAATSWTDVKDELPLYVFRFRMVSQPTSHPNYERCKDKPPTPDPDLICPESDFSSKLSICKGETDIHVAQRHAAVLFEGDKYDLVNRTVADVGTNFHFEPLNDTGARAIDLTDTPLFNLGCWGTAMAKLHLLRHTRASGFPAGGALTGRSQAQRQAMLKMLNADYCGTGVSFTVNGHKLRYQDADGWFTGKDPETGEALDITDLDAVRSIEGVWNAQGAVCLDTPRVARLDQIQKHCVANGRPKIPRCTPAPSPKLFWAELKKRAQLEARKELAATWKQLGYVLSANPEP